MNNHKQTVEEWFSREWGGSLYLPDGWFGRPYDNQHCLSSFRQINNRTELVLDNHLHLVFHCLERVYDAGRELHFIGFTELEFTWVGYGENSKRKSQTIKYGAGDVKVVASSSI